MHENDAAYAIANALMGEGVKIAGEPKEGKINIISHTDGLLKVKKDALFQFNMVGDVMCATLHNNTLVKKGQIVAGTRAIPLLVKKTIIESAVSIAESTNGVISVKEMRRPKAGIVITGNEVYYGKIQDAFAPVITKKLGEYHGDIVGIYYAPDDETYIKERLKELVEAGADLLITTGGMSVDPDDVTRFAIRGLGAVDMTYGSSMLPGAMFLVAYIKKGAYKSDSAESKNPDAFGPQDFRPSELVPVLGVPACGMYAKTTVFDLVLPRLLAGERIGRRELSELGHGGLCLKCKECRYPVCPFGK
jgi:molybdenum cofactor synthesis domain-containing protein